MVVEPTDDPSYRYELWKLDTNTPVHIRITARAIELHDPVLIERGSFDGYPVGYEWRVYQRHRQLARCAANQITGTTFPQAEVPEAEISKAEGERANPG
jgi:hypothetical protein